MGQPDVYTVVQHSGHGYTGGDADFIRGLESRQLNGAAERKTVVRAGGVLFPSYAEAEDFAFAEMYPPDYDGLIPKAQGTFAGERIDGLAVYIPPADSKRIHDLLALRDELADA